MSFVRSKCVFLNECQSLIRYAYVCDLSNAIYNLPGYYSSHFLNHESEASYVRITVIKKNLSALATDTVEPVGEEVLGRGYGRFSGADQASRQ